MGQVLTAWRAMHMVTVGCDCGSNCSCNAWGAAATNIDGDEPLRVAGGSAMRASELSAGEVAGGRTLGARLADVATRMAGKQPCAGSGRLRTLAQPEISARAVQD